MTLELIEIETKKELEEHQNYLVHDGEKYFVAEYLPPYLTVYDSQEPFCYEWDEVEIVYKIPN